MSTSNTGQRPNLIDEQARNAAGPGILATAFGGALTLFGLGITFLSEGGRGPGLVVLGVGGVLLALGIRATRRQYRSSRYRLTRPFSPGLFLFAVGAAVVLIVAAFFLAWVLDMKAAGMLLAIPPLIIPLYTGLRTALIMTRVGIGANGVNVPWSAVAQLAVTHTGGPEAEILLVQHDPNTTPTRAPVQGSKLELADFVQAASRFVPSSTAVLVNGQPLRPGGRTG
jgi:hypothetical protein